MQVEQIIQTLSPIMYILAQLALIIFLALAAWFIRNYVKAARAEREVPAIAHLANAAIDYAENLDKRGEVAPPPNLSKGMAKLALASDWLKKESRRAGISITHEAAQEWISSQFQRRVGEVKLVGTMGELANDALDFVERLVEGGLFRISEEGDRFVFICQLAADWMAMRMAERGATITSEEALTWVRAELLKRLTIHTASEEGQEDLARLVERSIAFVGDLRATNRLSSDDGDAARDLATAWILTEVAKRGLAYTPREIAAAVRFAIPESQDHPRF